MGIDFKKWFTDIFPPAPAQKPEPIQPIPVVVPPIAPLPPGVVPLPTLKPLIGIDISQAQGTIDWVKVAANGVKFAFIKATEGITVIDSQFHKNMAGARAAGIICSPYHFFHPGDDPHTTSSVFLKTIGELGPMDLPPMLDFEVLDKSTIPDAVKCAKAWLDLVDIATKKTPILYSDLGFFEELRLSADFAKYPLYIADISVKTAPIVKPWVSDAFFQYSWTGHVPGISTNVDMDYFYGTGDDLKALCK